MRRRCYATATCCALLVILAGCATARPTVGLVPRSPCAIVGARPAAATDTLAIAATGPIDRTRVPVPATATERFVFAQLYETLINVDCERHVYPGLARSWTLDETGTRVTLVIRDGAQFWNGKPVVAADVVAAWRATGGQSTEPSRLARRIADATTIVDDHTLTVSLPDTAWHVLADPALAVYQAQAGPAWPEGTTHYRVAEPAPSGAADLPLVPVWPTPGPYLGIRPLRSNDARDAIDRGADVLVTDDPLTISYAATHPELAAVPLPWSRTYALAARDVTPDLVAAADDSSLRVQLARDAVHAEARAAERPYWWSDDRACASGAGNGLEASSSQTSRTRRIVYRRDDSIARGLAERIVALGGRLTAAGLAPDDFARALRAGDEFAYVLGLPRTALSPCQDLAELAADAPWLVGGAGDGPMSSRLWPLIDTRSRAIVNRDHVSATIDWDGTLRFNGPGAP